MIGWMNPEGPTSQFLTVRQVAETPQISIKQVRRLVDRGEIPAHRFGRVWRINSDALAAFIEKCRWRREE